LVPYSKVKSKPVEWLWPGRIAFGTLTILEGKKGCGKSTIAAALAADVAGGPRIDGSDPRFLGDVLWLTLEEDLSTAVKQRLKAANADIDHVHFPAAAGRANQVQRLTLASDLARLEATIKKYKVKLVVLDPFTSFWPSTENMNDEQAVRNVLEPLQALAARTGCAFLLIRHLRKSVQGPAVDHGMGSTAIGNVARSVLRVDHYGSKKGWGCVSHVATNLGEKARTLLFELVKAKEGVRVAWRGEIDTGADDLANGQGDAGERGEREDAKAFLQLQLDVGEKSAKSLKLKAEDSGITPRTLRRAKEELGVVSEHRGEGDTQYWVWLKPEGGWPKG
jgi:hypothetical protein